MSRSSTITPQFLDSGEHPPSFPSTHSCFTPSSPWSSTPVSAPLRRISWPRWHRYSIQPTSRWIWITHPDRDHTGGLWKLLQAAPQARLITTFLGLGIMSTEWTLPLNRLYLLNPGQTLDVGDRRLQCLRPPLFDSPSTTGFLDERTGALFSSDCFGAPMPSLELATSADVRAVGDQVRDLQLLWATIDSPWVQNVTRHAYAPPLIRSGPWEPRRSSAATCRRYRSQTIDCSTPCCSHRKQAHSSGPTK